MAPLTKEHALDILKNPSLLQKDPDAVLIDDHRWTHMWAKTLSRHNSLFITESELVKLHGFYVDEFKRRNLNHDSPLEFGALHMGGELETIISHRQELQLEPEFLSIVGSSVSGKQEPNDIDLLVKSIPNDNLRQALLNSLPEEMKKRVEFVWRPNGPNGPFIPLYALKAVPIEQISYKEPNYHMAPMAPFPAPAIKSLVTSSDLGDLLEDSYYILPADGMRLLVHRRENQVMAFDAQQDEYELPEAIKEELLSIKDPYTFVLDCLLTSDKKSLQILDMPWWRESEHIMENAEVRRHFINKLESKPHLSTKAKYFSNRRAAIDYLKEETGPNIVVPGSTLYPIDGSTSEWLVYEQKPTLKLAESTDAEIKRRVDDGSWENLSADKRFSMMTKRQSIEPLYPFAQLKTTKKGYSEREVFGMNSVKTLAEDVFKVPNKEAVEVKIDGFRTQLHKKGERVRIFTESGHEITHRLPDVVESVKKIPANSFVLDSEGTPYAEDLTNLGRGGAAPAFAEGAHEPFDDSRFVNHVYDILYLDGKDLHDLPYEERRKILHGLELPVRDIPKDQGDFRNHLWENNVYWATSPDEMVKQAGQVSKVSGSEGAMFKQADSKYRLTGLTPLWSKMKNNYEIDALVVGVSHENGVYNYIGAIGPVKISDTSDAEQAPIQGQKGARFVKWKGQVYSVLGKSFNTKIQAPIGGIIRVAVKDIAPIENNLYHWFHPQVIEVREDKFKPDPTSVAEAISKTARGQQKTVVNEGIFEAFPQKRAYLVSTRFGEASELACCMTSWVAIETNGAYHYLPNSADVYSKMLELGVTDLFGTRMEREPMEKLMEVGISFHQVAEGLLGSLLSREATIEGTDPALGIDDVKALKEWQNSSTDLEGYSAMKLTCGSIVPLEQINLQSNPYVNYPDENKAWRFVTQMHVRGLSVHTDLRMQIDDGTLVGWTLDLGKSLIKPMLRRLSDSTLSKVNVTRQEITDTPIKDLSAKLHSTPEGKKLLEILTQKTQALPTSTLKAMLNELWREEVEPILKDPNRKILTEKKGTMSTAWLNEEGEVKPGQVGATSELEGQIIIMDKGTVEYGAQKPYFNEYWLHGDRLNGRVLVRRLSTRPEWGVKESFSWLSFFPKPEEKPYAVSRRAVSQKWYPPQGKSALPRKMREQIPHEYQYWRVSPASSHDMRDALVDEVSRHKVVLKLAARGAEFAIKRVWHKGPEVQRGLPIVRYWLLLHDGQKVLDAWDFGIDTDPTAETGITARRRDVAGMVDLLPASGEIPASHPASGTKQLTNHFDTVDTGSASFQMDKNNVFQMKLDGKKLKGSYVIVREDPGSDMWIFNKAEMNEGLKSLKLSSCDCLAQIGLNEVEGDYKTEVKGDVLIISGPAIKPGEWIPGNTGKPNYFTKEGIKRFWTQAPRKPIGVYHGPLKGDVVGYVDKVAYNEATGEGRIVRAVIWHPVAIALILEKKLLAFSIEIIPQTIWDPEHQHDHIIDGTLISVDLVPKGACRTCNIDSAVFGSTKPGASNQIYKFGMSLEDYIGKRYWSDRLSTQEIADQEGIPRSTVEHYMKEAGIPRRDLQEARSLRSQKEVLKMAGGKTSIIALGTGANNKMPLDDCPQCKEFRDGGPSRRNLTSTLFTNAGEQLLVNAPRGIFGMLELYSAKPRYVILDHHHEDAVGGLHELRSQQPMVAATQETWDYIRSHCKALSGQDGRFEDIYNFPRFVLRPGVEITLGKGKQFTLTPIPIEHSKQSDPKSIGLKILMDGNHIWHSSDVLQIPEADKVLKDIQIYIGDGSSLTRGVKREGDDFGHASIEEQLGWLKNVPVKGIYFTQIGHVGKTQKELASWLGERDAKSQALFDGAEIDLTASSPAAILPKRLAEKVANGDIRIILRSKPYQEFSKQVIYLVGGSEILALVVEGLPEGPISAKEARNLEHGMNDAEWKRMVGDSQRIWVYHPKIVKRYESPRGVEINPKSTELYLRETRIR